MKGRKSGLKRQISPHDRGYSAFWPSASASSIQNAQDCHYQHAPVNRSGVSCRAQLRTRMRAQRATSRNLFATRSSATALPSCTAAVSTPVTTHYWQRLENSLQSCVQHLRSSWPCSCFQSAAWHSLPVRWPTWLVISALKLTVGVLRRLHWSNLLSIRPFARCNTGFAMQSIMIRLRAASFSVSMVVLGTSTRIKEGHDLAALSCRRNSLIDKLT